MTLPPPIDPRELAAEIDAAVSDFNRLVHLAGSLGLQVEAELQQQAMPDQPGRRPVLAVQVIAPL
jgi:hypothetical protein